MVGLTNAVNLIDGVDGLATGVSAIAAIVMFALTWGEFPLIPVLTLILAGAALGFLPHNFSPARIFLGDTGSLFLGFLLAGFSIMGVTKQATLTTLIIPVIIFGLPITDTFYAIWRRFRNGQPIFKADKGHIHHRLLDVGLTTRQTVLILYFCSIYFGAAAIVFNRFTGFSRYLIPLTLPLSPGCKRLEGLSDLLSTDRKRKCRKKGIQMTLPKIMSIIVTRTEAIKMAPLIRALRETGGVQEVLCLTAQHREMLDQVLSLFNLTAHYDLDIMKERQSLTYITTRALEGLEEIIRQEQPQLILVQGDTTTTLAGSLAAFYHKIPLGHVEAGLRTGDKYAPFPEEINRRLNSVLADLHFAPTVVATTSCVRVWPREKCSSPATRSSMPLKPQSALIIASPIPCCRMLISRPAGSCWWKLTGVKTWALPWKKYAVRFWIFSRPLRIRF